MLDKQKKDEIIKKFKTHKNDTGSPEVQIAILTAEIKELTEHLKLHKKDFSSRRGLIKKLNQRRRLLRYLERENSDSFEKLAKKLEIKITKVSDMLLEDEMKIEEDVEKDLEEDVIEDIEKEDENKE
ncbi:MAG: 30S ribosomal protein S15 [Patescibacteria group bacterium]|nr:30S ribosomal protein S15 [Patescibacteria group bacterium]